jgi:hypothetical protein
MFSHPNIPDYSNPRPNDPIHEEPPGWQEASDAFAHADMT